MTSVPDIILPDIILPKAYDEVRHRIRDADLVLKRGGGLIPAVGRSVYRHAGMAVWWDGDLMLVEMLQFRGGRAVTMRSQVKRWPGKLDVFRTAPGNRWPEFDRVEAARFVRRLAGQPYNYAGLVALSLLHLPIVRLLPAVRRFVRRGILNGHSADGRLADRLGARFCSEAVSLACRIGGHVDPVPMLGDRLTEPADLARSQFFEYRFTLVP